MKVFKLSLASVFLFGLIVSCQKKSSETINDEKHFILNLEAVTRKLIERSNLQPGERVLLMGKPGEFDSLVILLSEKIKSSEAIYLGAVSIDTTSWPQAGMPDFA